MSCLPELLRARAAEAPDAPFLFFKDQRWTRGELQRAAEGAASRLASLGVRAGDRVALLLPNCPEFLVYYFGVMRLGGVVVPVNTLLKEPELAFILGDSGAKGLLAGPAHQPLADRLRSASPALGFVERVEAGLPKEALLASLPKEPPAQGLPAQDAPAAILYTSGTTGFPKGAVLTHANYLFDVEATARTIGLESRDRFLCFLPLFHVNGQVVTVLMPLHAGGSLVLMEKFQPKEFFELLQRHRCTAFSGVPSVYAVLLNLPDADRYDLSSLRFCICGAAPMPVEVFERFEAKFKAHILEGFGLSEATCVSSVNPPPPGPRKVGSIGLPLPGQEMRIADSAGRELPAGEVGEIVVRGPNVMPGYWNNPAATKEALQDGWLRTGDLGRKDEDGYFFIVGRKKEMIIRGGENIYPKEIEEALYRHPAVAEAAVIGLPDRRWGEEVAAFVVLKEGAAVSPRELLSYLRERVADYKVPRRLELAAALPKTATGKIQKLKLRAECCAKEGLGPVNQ
ncbi:MAG: long-chain fatty acid--CoA ligase [Elusimicrobia bacterium]|nr:long-chain fatty acid--CoA ligase [Elusimicrobiota bacterium]